MIYLPISNFMNDISNMEMTRNTLVELRREKPCLRVSDQAGLKPSCIVKETSRLLGISEIAFEPFHYLGSEQ